MTIERPFDSAAETRRYALLDALRGVAAMLVVFYHLYYKNLYLGAHAVLPEPFHTIFINGHLGVSIFFVLSGFVIASSVADHLVDWPFARNYILRRIVRLDPPYWATIALALLATYMSESVQKRDYMPMPSAFEVLAHLFYVHQFFGIPDIVGVFWTLCIEVQFYLVFILTLAAFGVRVGGLLVFLPLYVVSLLCVAGWLDIGGQFFVVYWHSFYLGMITLWVARGWLAPAWLFAAMAAACGVLAWKWDSRFAAGLATISLIYLGWRFDFLKWTGGWLLQYLGRISYSLYLIHMVVGSRVVRMGMRQAGDSMSMIWLIGILAAGVVASIVAAHVMYVCLERPSVELARRLKRTKTPDLAQRARPVAEVG